MRTGMTHPKVFDPVVMRFVKPSKSIMHRLCRLAAAVALAATARSGSALEITVTNLVGGAMFSNPLDGIPDRSSETFRYYDIENGAYRLNTSLFGDVSVARSGTLGGNGTIYGDVFLGGTMAPGNSIGTMTINGNYFTNSDSIQQIEINSGGFTPGVHADLIVVNGNVNLNGGTVSVVMEPGGGFRSGMTYHFLSHSGTRSGTFDGITINSAFLTSSLIYNPKTIGFVLSRNSTKMRDVAETQDQQQAATYLDSNESAATGDAGALFDKVLSLDAASARSAFDQLSGSVYGSAAQANLQNLTQMYQMLGRNTSNFGGAGSPAGTNDTADVATTGSSYRFAAQSPDDLLTDGRPMVVPTVPSPRRRIWNAWSSSYGSVNGSSDSIGSYAAGGTMLAVDRALSDAWNFGGFGTYSYVSLHSTTPADQQVRQNGGLLGTYLRGDDGANHLLAASALGFDGYDSNRQIPFAGVNSSAAGDYGGWQCSTYLEYGRRFEVRRFDLEPFVALQYAHVRQNEFMETGAGAANLQVDGVDADSLRGILGSRFSWDGVWRRRLLRPELHAAWIHEYLDAATTFNSVLAGVGGTSFATQGADFGRDWGLFGGGLNVALTDRILLAGHYDVQANPQAVMHLGSATAEVRW